MADSSPARGHSKNHARLHASRCTGDITTSNVQSSDQSASLDSCHLLSFGPVQCRKVETGSVLTRSFSEPLGEGKRQQQWAAQRAVDDSHEHATSDTASSGLIGSQKIADSSEELTSPGDRKDKGREAEDGDLVCGCEWTTTGDGSLDSGRMSDVSSPSVTGSPHQSLINDGSQTDQGSDEDYAVTKHLNDLELDGKQPATAGGLVPAPVSVQTRAPTQSLPRYVRPMREIPPRFRRLLVAEAERVVRLCHRLNGSPLRIAGTPSDAVPQNDSRAASSDINRNIQAAFVDKAVAGHTSYTDQSSVVYVTAPQSSGLPVYPPAPQRAGGCSTVVGADASSYVVPVGVTDASLPGCAGGLPTDGLQPSVPMMLPSPVFYYHNASLPSPDVGSAFSYVIPVPVVGGYPQSGTAETGRSSAAVKNAHSDQTSVVTDVGHLNVFQPPPEDGIPAYNSYYYNAPGPELLPFCPHQLMLA